MRKRKEDQSQYAEETVELEMIKTSGDPGLLMDWLIVICEQQRGATNSLNFWDLPRDWSRAILSIFIYNVLDRVPKMLKELKRPPCLSLGPQSPALVPLRLKKAFQVYTQRSGDPKLETSGYVQAKMQKL